MENLEVLVATNKQSSTKNNDKDKSEDKTGKSKNKTKKFYKKNSKSTGEERKINDSDSDDNWCNASCAIYNAKCGLFWTHNAEDCRILAEFRKKKKQGNSRYDQERVPYSSEHSDDEVHQKEK